MTEETKDRCELYFRFAYSFRRQRYNFRLPLSIAR